LSSTSSSPRKARGPRTWPAC